MTAQILLFLSSSRRGAPGTDVSEGLGSIVLGFRRRTIESAGLNYNIAVFLTACGFSHYNEEAGGSSAAGRTPIQMSLSEPRVSIVILNWNSYQVTLDCLVSLRNMDYRNFEMVLVDNGSVDGSPA